MTAASPNSRRARALRRAGVEVLRVPRKGKRTDLRAVIAALGERQILNLMIEGGSELNGAALASGIVDKLVLFYAPKLLGCDGLPFADAWGKALASLPPLGELSLERFGPDIMLEGYLRDVYRDH